MMKCFDCSNGTLKPVPFAEGPAYWQCDACLADVTTGVMNHVVRLENQLAAQRAIVAADDEYDRVKYDMKTGLDEELAADAARATTRMEATRIDEAKT